MQNLRGIGHDDVSMDHRLARRRGRHRVGS